MIYFPEHPQQLNTGDREFQLISPYVYEWKKAGERYRMIAPEGFIHDGASIPGIVWSFIPPQPLDRAAVFHDLLYQRGGVLRPGEWQKHLGGEWVNLPNAWGRVDSDRLFGRMLRKDPDGPGKFRRRLAYKAVRWFGEGSWQR